MVLISVRSGTQPVKAAYVASDDATAATVSPIANFRPRATRCAQRLKRSGKGVEIWALSVAIANLIQP